MERSGGSSGRDRLKPEKRMLLRLKVSRPQALKFDLGRKQMEWLPNLAVSNACIRVNEGLLPTRVAVVKKKRNLHHHQERQEREHKERAEAAAGVPVVKPLGGVGRRRCCG